MQNLIKIDKSHINPSYPCPSVHSVVKNSLKSADSPYDRRATSSSPAPGSSRATTTAPLPLHFSFSDFAVGYASSGFACVIKFARVHAAISASAFIHDVPDETRVERTRRNLALFVTWD